MRLLTTNDFTAEQLDLNFVELAGEDIPPYAILSHTWDDDEVMYIDLLNHTASQRRGFWKVQAALKQAFEHGIGYMWIDSCCINKESSAELSEAINSMFNWYQQASACYAYLADVRIADFENMFPFSRWFTRGWTLQELLAPSLILFYSNTWQPLGDKNFLKSVISEVTTIDEKYLDGSWSLEAASVAERMSWAALRETTRPEDIAYSLMGLFSVNMPMLYGEGRKKAFLRLQEEIMKVSGDQSLFAWTDTDMHRHDHHGLLADSPKAFLRSRGYTGYDLVDERNVFTMTSLGLCVTLHLANLGEGVYAAALMCPHPHSTESLLAVYLQKLPEGENQFARFYCDELLQGKESWTPQKCYIRQNVLPTSLMGRNVNEFFQVCIRGNPRSFQWSAIQMWSTIREAENDVMFPLPIKRMDHEIITEPPVMQLRSRTNTLAVVLGLERIIDGKRFLLMIGSRSRGTIGYDLKPVDDTTPNHELVKTFDPKRIWPHAPIVEMGDDFHFFIEFEERLRREGKLILVDLTVRLDPFLDPVEKPPSYVSVLFERLSRGLGFRKPVAD